MGEFKLIACADPLYNNLAYNEIANLNTDQYTGAAVIFYALFGYPSDCARIYLQSGSNVEQVDYGMIAESPDVMLLQGDVVDTIRSERWLIDISDLGINVKLEYTVKIYTPRGKYLIQFANLDLLRMMGGIVQSLGLDPGNYLQDLHRGDLAVTDPIDM